MAARTQLTMFLPEPLRATVNECRAQWDPEMARRIDAHITIVHDATQLDSLDDRLASLAEKTAPALVRVTSARWAGPDEAIYLGVDDVAGVITSIRDSLHVIDSADVTYTPHVTLVHPRTTPRDRALEAWQALSEWSVDQSVTIDELAVIEYDGTRWQRTRAVRLRRGVDGSG